MLRLLRPPPLPDDINVELVALLFTSVQKFAIATVPASAIIVATYVAWRTDTNVSWGLAAAVLMAVVVRVAVILSFKARHGALTKAAVRRWAAVYGASAVAICAVMGSVTAIALGTGGTLAYAPFGWCIATAVGIPARTATVPWIPVVSAAALLLPPAAAAFHRPEAEFWLTGGIAILVLCSVRDCAEHLYTTCVDRLMARSDAALLARTDALTGLANRLAMNAMLEAACGGADAFAFLYVDLDGFKAVNDGHGHSVGDALLIEVAARLRQVAGASPVARLGGDEFGVLHPADRMRPGVLATLVVEHLSLPYYIDGRVLRVGASVGIAFGEGGAQKPAALLLRADEALYLAKASGKGQWKAEPEWKVA